MNLQTHYDLIIAGGGPAGTTVATLVKKYAPHLRVLLLEKSRFPRHHIGESLLAGATPVLHDMEVYNRIDGYGFVEKSGATYVWGKERTPWGFDFDQAVKLLLDAGQPLPRHYVKGWQVRRAEYDHQLLLHAADMGVEVREEAAVSRVIWDQPDTPQARVIGIEYQDAAGVSTLHCHWFMDCTGQDALLGRHLALRQFFPQMNNVALYGYWRDFSWQEAFLGRRAFTRIFLVTSPHGWFWCIPASPDIMSVGLVTNRESLKLSGGDAEKLYRSEIEACPEIAAVLNGASLTRLYPDQRRDILAERDWSYESRQMAGAGWAMCGDAAGFVDPILSSGVMIAHELGQKAAYTLNSTFRATTDADIARYWQFYEQTYRTYLRAYRDMAEFWYGSNFAMDGWWWQAQRAVNQPDTDTRLPPRESFVRLASGYANRAESLSLFGSYPLHEAQRLADGLFGLRKEQPAAQTEESPNRPLKLSHQARFAQGLYYFQGLLRQTARIENIQTGRYLDLHPAEEPLLRLFTGAHTLADLAQEIQTLRRFQPAMPVRDAGDLIAQLDAIGTLM
jgi:clorobiocin biosynthesis protein Clo-hal